MAVMGKCIFSTLADFGTKTSDLCQRLKAMDGAGEISLSVFRPPDTFV